jgi:hypothetical protein
MSDSQTELRELIARAIDGDLTRAERRTLFTRLLHDPAARQLLSETVALENDLARFGSTYESAAPRQNAAMHQAAAARSGILRLGYLRPRFSGGLVTGVLAASLLFAVYHLALAPAERALDRFEIFALGFAGESDLASWTHQHEVAAGQSARLLITAVDCRTPFHMRLSSDRAIAMVVEHRRKGEDAQHDRMGGAQIHYAVLRDPQAGDELVFRNNGAEPVRISLAAGSADAAAFHRDLAEAGQQARLLPAPANF